MTINHKMPSILEIHCDAHAMTCYEQSAAYLRPYVRTARTHNSTHTSSVENRKKNHMFDIAFK